MAYSPSVQYGYYKRLEFSLFVFFSFFFLFLKFFFATLEKNFLLFFFLYKIPSTQTLIQLSLWLE